MLVLEVPMMAEESPAVFFVKTHIAKCGRVKRTFAIFFKFFLFSLEKNPTFVAENTFSDRRYLATVVL